MARVLRPDEMRNKETIRKAVDEKKPARAGMPAFLSPSSDEAAVADPGELAHARPSTPVVVLPVKKDDPR